MVEISKCIIEVEKLILDNIQIEQIKDKYTNICNSLHELKIELIDCEQYREFCKIPKKFINQQDLNCPAARLSLVKSSIGYIFDKMEIVWLKLHNDKQELDELKNEMAIKYNYRHEDVTKNTLKIDYPNEKKELERLFGAFVILHDKINENDDNSSIAVFNAAYKIIQMLMTYYLSEQTTVKLLKDWEKVQDIIFPLDETYRDHLIHQFYVFLMGSSMLSKLEQRIVENWKIFDLRENELEIKRRNFRAWMSASIFHDMGYIAGKLNEIGKEIYKQFFKNLPGLECLHFELKMDSDDKIYSEYLNLMEKVFRENEFRYYRERETDERAVRIEKAMGEMDHGAITSYLFWNTIQHDIGNIRLTPIETIKAQMFIGARISSYYSENPDGPTSTIHKMYSDDDYLLAIDNDVENDEKFKQEVKEDIDIAAYAIALHNLKSYTRTNFVTHPVTFLLILCDELQQWGRVSYKDQKPITTANDLIECKVFLNDTDNDELLLFINKFDDIDHCIKLSSLNDKEISLREVIFEKNTSDFIVIRYENINEKYLEDFNTKMRELFTYRLENGPSIFLTNRKNGKENIFFIAINLEARFRYEIIDLK